MDGAERGPCLGAREKLNGDRDKKDEMDEGSKKKKKKEMTEYEEQRK